MRRLILLLAAMGLLVLAVYLVTRPGADRGAPTPGKGPGIGSGGDQVDDPEPSPGPAGSQRGEISGTVKHKGAPVAARVELRRLPSDDAHPDSWTAIADSDGSGPVVAACDAGDSGAFLVRGLDPGRYELRATAGGATGVASAKIRHPGERVRRDILIPSGPHVLEGRAVYADGRPFEGLVAALGAEKGRRLSGTVCVRPDAEGRFRIPGLGEGIFRLFCHLPMELRYSSRTVRVPHPGEFLVVVDGGTTPLEGRVVADDDGAPIQGAEVSVHGDTAQNREGTVLARTDESGRFNVRALPVWRTITVRAKGYSPVHREIDEGVEKIEIRLGRAGSVGGRVLSAGERRPLPGVTVRYRPIDPYHPDPGGRTTSDAAGRYAFDSLPNCEIMLYAAGGGWISPGVASAREMEANPLALRVAPGTAAEVDLLVERALRVTGRVLDATGEGVPGIVVHTTVWHMLGLIAEKTTETITDERGLFVFDGLMPDTVHGVWAQPPGRAQVLGGYVSGSPGGYAEMVIRLPDESVPTRWLDLQVLELSSREPVPGARVYGAGLEGRTDTDGRARLGPLHKGRVEVWVYHPDYMLLQKRPILEEGSSGVLSQIVELRKGLAIAGRVLLPDGRPLENGTVWVNSVDPAAASAPGGSDVGEVTADGLFRVGGLLAGKYKVKIGGTHDQGGYWATRVVEAGESDLVFTTERYVGQEARTLLLRIVDPDRKPVPRATVDVRLRRDESTWEDEYEVHDGKASIEFWEDGLMATISVNAARTSSGAPLPFGPVLYGPLPLRAGEMEIRLNPALHIGGIVRVADGEGVRGVRIEAMPTYADELEFDNPHAVAFTDARGAFRLPGLGATEYRLTLSVPEGYLPVEPVLAIPGGERMRIEIRRGASVRVTVRDPEGALVPGAWVSAETTDDGPGLEGTTVTRADGAALLVGLDRSRKCRLIVSPPAGRDDLLRVVIADWAPVDDEVVLPSGRLVAGVVREENGDRASGVIVQARMEGGGWDRKEVARDGSFTFGPFAEGQVELAARRKGTPFSGHAGETVFVAAGTEDVALTVAAGRTLTARVLNWSPSYGPGRAKLTVGGSTRWAVVEADGTAIFTGLPAKGDAALWVGPVGDGLYLLLGGIRADSDAVEASLVRGGAVSGRLILPPDARLVQVRLDGTGYTMSTSVVDDGTFTFTGVPEGKCVVTAQARVGGSVEGGHQWTEAGGTVEIEILAR